LKSKARSKEAQHFLPADSLTARSHGGSSHWWTGRGRKARELLQRSLSSGYQRDRRLSRAGGSNDHRGRDENPGARTDERGTRCFLSGRCRLPNSYLYDKEIIPRVEKAIIADGHFADTSVWAEGQRRWVSLKGCVRRKEQAKALEQLVRQLDDVEAVINQLVVKQR